MLVNTALDLKVFVDVAKIDVGRAYVDCSKATIASCRVLLSVIGPGWLDVRDEDGHRRLDDPKDFVRLEIFAALASDPYVIPVLIDDTRIPKKDELRGILKQLRRNHHDRMA